MASKTKKATAVAETETANTNKYAIEKGIPMPARQRFGGTGPSPYPFDDMELEDAFFIAVEVDTSGFTDEAEKAKAISEDQRKIANRLSGATRRFSKDNEGVKFGVRSAEKDGIKGVRVWRTA